MIGEKTLELLKQVLAESSYTVAICGSGMMEEGGILGLKQKDGLMRLNRNIRNHRRSCFTFPVCPEGRNDSMNFTARRY